MRRPGAVPPLVGGYVTALAAAAAVVAWTAPRAGWPGRADPVGLASIVVLVGLAEWFTVRVRVGREVNALTLVEAALAPLLFAFPSRQAVLAVALGMLGAGLLRRNAPVKLAFNVAVMGLSAGCGSLVVRAVADGAGLDPAGLFALVCGLAVVLVVNQAGFVLVLLASDPSAAAATLRSLAPVVVPGWLGGWCVNVLVGLLYVLAYESAPRAVLLDAVPLVVLYAAYRGYAGAQADRRRLHGLHRAAQELAGPLDPWEGVPAFLREVARCFEAAAATLVLREGGGRELRRVDADGALDTRVEPDDLATLEGALAAHPGPQRVQAGDGGALAEELAARGCRECLSAPVLVEGRLAGALLVFDRSGVEADLAAETPVLEALASEAATALVRARLLATLLEERRRLADVVGSTSDGIASLARDGTVLSWNPAMERCTGLTATEVLGRPLGQARLRPRTVDGRPVDLSGWKQDDELPPDLLVQAVDASARRLACSYSVAFDDEGVPVALVVVARDVTQSADVQELRAEVGRLAQADATRRAAVEQLQEAVMPARPPVAGAELSVAYLASDPSAPTGGDAYDWQVLPSGELHVCVVDVLGHGVAATKDALAVVHTIRVLTAEGLPLGDVVHRADELLSAQHPDLVATVVLARYDPESGRLQVAGGGHPPALVARAAGAVEQLEAPGGAVGWPNAGSVRVEQTVLGPGDALLLYTDGLVEARKDLVAGLAELERHAEAVRALPVDDLTEQLLERALSGAERHDDSLALVVRRSLDVRRRAQWRAPASPASVTALRGAARSWFAGQADSPCDDLALAVSELLTNAVRAARTEVALALELCDDRLRVEVTDDGPGAPALDARGRVLPDDEAVGGRGLFLVRSVADAVHVESGPGGTRWVADLPLPATAPDSDMGGPPVQRPGPVREDATRLRAV